MKEEQGFHSSYDANYGALHHDRSRSALNQTRAIKNLLSYRFYPHLHPYVAGLVERLIKKSVPGLQAADTEYCSSANKDGTLEVLPDSTLVALNDEIELNFPDGSTLKASKGTQVFLPHGTWVRLEDQNHTVTIVPGTMKTTEPLAMVFYRSGSKIQVEANKGILTLNSSQEVRLPQGQLVALPAGTQLLFLGCKPRPQLYSETFFSLTDRLIFSLVANWKFDEGAGILATDVSSYGNNGELIGGASWTRQGKIKGAITFDGGNYVKVENSDSLEQIGRYGTDFSVAFWIYLREGHTGQYRSIMHKGNTNYERTFALFMSEVDNRIIYRITTTLDSTVGEGRLSVNQIELEKWTHICYIKSENTLKLYINGDLDSGVVLRGASTGNNGPLYMGKDPWYNGFNGSLDDVHIYDNLALSEKEIDEVATGLLYPYIINRDIVEKPYPVKDLDFSPSGAYSVYNWELFYHVPITLAIHLSKNQRFEEAQQWFHYIFDPTSSSSGDDNTDLPTPERFWKVKPFQFTDVKLIEEILSNLSSGVDVNLKQETINSLEAWKNAPFRPHVVARYRQTAYMFKTVMAYLDNLIDWGDSLFRQDTGESINEATQLYVLAANILGPRPQAVPKKKLSARPKTYASLRADPDNSSKVLRDLETDIPFDLAPFPNNNNIKATDMENRSTTLRTMFGTALYFCVPRNDKLLSYWDTMADRLFKIHNSLNIQGIFRQLPLFEPPIDPALLAKAAAAGLDVSAIVSGINQPLPLVRFQFLVQKAAEICQEVKSLGNNLLSTIEKEDNEALAVLRAKHERTILVLAETVKYGQLQEAIKAREGLEKSINNAIHRYIYYERLLGKQQSEIKIPELDAIDKEASTFSFVFSNEPEVGLRPVEIDIAQDVDQNITGGKKISSHELVELNFMKNSQDLQDTAAEMDLVSSVLAMIPEFSADVKPIGVGAGILMGGQMFSRFFAMVANAQRAQATKSSYEARKAEKIGSYARREQEWAFQSNAAAGEITQIFKQIRAAQIREAMAEIEWKNHQQQIQFAKEIERFLTDEKTGKRTNQAFYSWMKREVKGLYAQCFQFAFDIAKKAERALQHELGNQELSFIQFNYLAGKEGLLAGEKLYLDIKHMEMAYHNELNKREYELTKHVSLLQVNPEALLKLRTTGSCTVFLPEELFDMDCPGHYFRRIKSVSVSIPCVTGPYSSVNCTLTLLKSSIRKNTLLRDGVYAREGTEDNRFSDHFGSMQSIVTSTAQNDSGLFETNLRDERYLPFEGSGVISEWQLEMPEKVRQFDYDTISDVILHFHYTAREGGGLLRREAIKNLENQIQEAQAAGSIRLFSIRHEFPSEWTKFTSIKIEGSTKTSHLKLELRQEHFTFWSQDRIKSVKRVHFFAKKNGEAQSMKITEKADGTGEEDIMDSSLGNLWRGQLTNLPLPQIEEGKPLSIKFNLNFTDNTMEDLWLALTWGK